MDISAVQSQEMSSFEALEIIEEGILEALIAEMEAFISLAILINDASAVLKRRSWQSRSVNRRLHKTD